MMQGSSNAHRNIGMRLSNHDIMSRSSVVTCNEVRVACMRLG